MTIEEHSKSRLYGARWALGLDLNATVEEIEGAHRQHLANAELLAAARRDRDELTTDRDTLRGLLNAAQRDLSDTRRNCKESNAAAAHNFREATRARDERDEARRLHATAVEELARVKMNAPTVNPLTLFCALSYCEALQDSTISEVRTLAEELSGKLGAP